MLDGREIFVHILCGEKGVGKTSFAAQKWGKHLLLACGDALNLIKTTGALYFALSRIYDGLSDDLWDIVKHLRKALHDGFVLIIDEAENIDESLLKTIVNTAVSCPNCTIIFTFDYDCEHIYKSRVFRQLIEWDIVPPNESTTNFHADIEVFNVLIRDSIQTASDEMKTALIEITNYNFNNLKRLLWLIINKQTDFTRINGEVIAEYSYFLVEEKLSSLPNDLLDILKKSSLIGEMFQSCVLESPDGFHVPGVKAYLRKLEATNLFIQSYVQDDIYRFVTSRMYTGVLQSIEPIERIASQKILLNYYMTKLVSEQKSDNILECLQQIRRLAYDLNDYEIMLFSEKKLLFIYIQIEDIRKSREILNSLLRLYKDYFDDTMIYLYLSYYKIRIDMSSGFYDDAIGCIESIQSNYPNDGNVYLQYYYTKCLYGIGDVDCAYSEIEKLVNQLQLTSSKAVVDQPIYALAYSLLATIQNHLGIADYGNHYYALALNHSMYKLNDRAIYFDILKKCDMYYGFQHSQALLLQSIAFFESTGKVFDAAEVSVNLATEMMFNDNNLFSDAETLFNKATKAFFNTPNESLAYSQNNWALLKIIQNGEFVSALTMLQNSLFVGMTAFTYMTIYLNICMCMLSIHGCDSVEFIQAYDEFRKYYSNIKARENSTQYEDVYMGILDLLVMERRGQHHELTAKVDALCTNLPSQFFIPILKDIKARNSAHNNTAITYLDNNILYEVLNKYRIFLAEFRFWE